MKLIFLGTGNAFGDSGDHPAAYLVQHGDYKTLLDCGPSTLPLLYKAGGTPKDLTGVYISHLHQDHWGGLPHVYLDDYYFSKRKEPLPIYGPRGLKAKLEEMINIMYPDEVGAHFDSFCTVYEHEIDEKIEVAGGEMEFLEASHGANARMLRFSLPDLTIGYSGDTALFLPTLGQLLNSCDVIIHEVTSAIYDIPNHTSMQEILKVDVPKNVKLYITHHDQSVVDYVGQNGLPPNFYLARDGMIVNL